MTWAAHGSWCIYFIFKRKNSKKRNIENTILSINRKNILKAVSLSVKKKIQSHYFSSTSTRNVEILVIDLAFLISSLNLFCWLQNDLDDPERGMIFVCSATHKTKVGYSYNCKSLHPFFNHYKRMFRQSKCVNILDLRNQCLAFWHCRFCTYFCWLITYVVKHPFCWTGQV